MSGHLRLERKQELIQDCAVRLLGFATGREARWAYYDYRRCVIFGFVDAPHACWGFEKYGPDKGCSWQDYVRGVVETVRMRLEQEGNDAEEGA